MPVSRRAVEIVGGGLAGLALGHALSRHGLEVTIREAGNYPRHRVCGEFIAGLEPATLEALGLAGLLEDAPRARTVAWFDRRGEILRRPLAVAAWCVSRHRLDAVLAGKFAAAGGTLRTADRTPPVPAEGRVLACGRHPDTRSRLVGMKAHFRGLELSADLEMHLGRGAYVGVTRVEDGAVNVCGLFPRERASGGLAGAVRSSRLAALARRLDAAEPVSGSACAVAALDYGRAHREGFCVGDRGGLVPPFTGHGMAIAFQGAAAVAPALERWAAGDLPWDETIAAARDAHDRRIRRKTSFARALHPLLLHPAGQFLIRGLCRAGLLPFGALTRLVH